MSVQCDHCGRFLSFADLAFAEHHFVPLNEFGPEESSFTGACCRYRDRDAAEGGDANAAPVPQDQQARPEGIAEITQNTPEQSA